MATTTSVKRSAGADRDAMNTNGCSRLAVNHTTEASSSTISSPSPEPHLQHGHPDDILHHDDEATDPCMQEAMAEAADEHAASNPQPAKHDFLVSFLVDARGGSLTGCRHTGVKVIIPPKTVPQPMRITCRYVKKDALLHPPPLNEGEGLACRILQVGPRGSRFLGSVLIEVPHVASLRNGHREVVILRCDSASKGKWTQHIQEADIDEKTLNEMLNDRASSPNLSTASTSSSSPAPRLEVGSSSASRSGASPSHNRYSSSSFHSSHHHQPPLVDKPQQFVRILANTFPQYFAIISRGRQDLSSIGPEGGHLVSSVVPQARVEIRPKALVKTANVGICVMRADDEMVDEILIQGGSVSPILTIEPRRRKFHRPITITMPLPNKLQDQIVPAMSARPVTSLTKTTQSRGPVGSIAKSSSLLPPDPVEEALGHHHRSKKSGTKKKGSSPEADAPKDGIAMSLRLLCSMSGNYAKACWEDVTDTTPMMIQVNEETNHILVEAQIENNVKRKEAVVAQPAQQSPPGCAQFASVVSATFWMVYCPNWMSCDLLSLVDRMHKNVMRVPYFCRFHVYARHQDESHVFCTPRAASSPSDYLPAVCHVRILCLSEADRAVHPLELQEDFVEVCRSEPVEVYDKAELDVRFGGNLAKCCRDECLGSEVQHKEGDCSGSCDEFDHGTGKRFIVFQPFSDNRQGYAVKRRMGKNPYAKGTVALRSAANNKNLFETKIDLSKFY